MDAYISQVNDLVSAQRAAVARLAAPAQATASALLSGGRFYLNNSFNNYWFYEGIGRAGGLMQIEEYTASATPRAGDVVWISYTASTYQNALDLGTRLSAQKVFVVAFGPQSPEGPPPFANWIDSLTPWTSDDHLTILANVLSLWTLEGELAAATARQGKTLVFWEGIAVPGGPDRNAHYTNQIFHDGFPKMEMVEAGALSATYLDTIAALLAQIAESEAPQIAEAGRLLAQRSAGGKPPALVVTSHLLPFLGLENNTLFRYIADPANLDQAIAQSGWLVDVGYSGVDLELWRKVRLAGAQAVWIIGELPNQGDLSEPGDIFIHQHWQLGDASVLAPGYDVRLLPVSGVAQLFIYDLMLKAAEEP